MESVTFVILKSRRLLTIVFAAFFIYGCEGFVEYEGRIVDEFDGLGIDSASIVLYVDNKNVANYFSDELGNFKIVYGVVGCVPSCPSSKIEVVKEGYSFVGMESINDTSMYYLKSIENSN